MLSHIDKCIDHRGSKYLYDIFHDIANAMGVDNPHAALDLFSSMIQDLKMQNPVAGNREKELEILSTSVNPIRLKNNPIGIDVEIIKCLYEKILK